MRGRLLALMVLAGCSSESEVPKIDPVQGHRGEVLTAKNDNARTGANLDEDLLDPAAARKLGLAASLNVDGEVYAQPLVVADVETPAGKKALALVATTNSSVYAFDLDAPDGAAPVWQVGKSRELGTPGVTSRNVNGPNGILSTPVVDRARNLLYVVARSCNDAETVQVGCPDRQVTASRCRAHVHALDIRTGEIRASQEIVGSVQNARNEAVLFDATTQWNRPALLLEGDRLFVAFGSGPNGNQHEEDFVYHGWMFRLDVTDLARPPAVLATTPNGRGGSVWQSGAGPASDGQNVFFTSANAILDCETHPPSVFPSTRRDAEDSVLRLTLDHGSGDQAGALVYSDTRPYTAAGFSGTVFQFTNSGDVGFGSSGPTVIPDSRDVLVGSKGGIVYLLDRDTMQPTQPPISPFTALPLQGDHTLYIHSWSEIPTIPGAFAFFRPETAPGTPGPVGYLYAWAADDFLRSFRYDYAARTLVLDRTANVPAMPGGAYVSLSARGHTDGTAVLWVTSRTVTGDARQGHAWAFDAKTLDKLWDTDTPSFSKFTPPTVARGRLLVPSSITSGAHHVLVYGVPL
jgi:outer membrane protein assembly factor BamB